MARKHGRTPAYEIMQSVGSGTPLPRSKVRNMRGGSVGLFGLIFGLIKRTSLKIISLPRLMFGGGGGAQASSARPADANGAGGGLIGAVARPVEMRLPWGLVALLSVTFVALLGLMFQIGQHVATRSAPQNGVIAQDAPENAASGATAAGVSDSAAAPDSEDASAMLAQAPSISPMGTEPDEYPGGEIVYYDQRAVGLNYFVLTTVPENLTEDVRELQKFLAKHGLKTYLDKPDRRGQRVLVDVTRGYTRAERGEFLHFDHERRIRQLGKMWKAENNGRGTDLSDIYADRFDGASDLKKE